MKFIGNLVWLLFGGLPLALGWAIAGLILCLTIVGIPAGVQCLKIAGFALWPFGRRVSHGQRLGSFLLNLLWILIFGWELALVSVLAGLILCVTIIGIPFAVQCFKLAKLSLMPFGAKIQ